jgi:hypothetical protein
MLLNADEIKENSHWQSSFSSEFGFQLNICAKATLVPP